jgi:hypothetical protein
LAYGRTVVVAGVYQALLENLGRTLLLRLSGFKLELLTIAWLL